MLGLFRKGAALGAAAFVVMASCVTTAPTASARSWLNIDDYVDTVKGWKLGYSKGFAGCLAYARFTDETTVWFGLSLKKGYFIALTNPKWSYVESGAQFSLRVKMRGYNGAWNGKFLGFQRGDDKGVFIGNLKQEFMVQFAKAAGFRIYKGGQRMAGLSLHGSHDALLTIANCYEQRRSQAERDKAESERNRPRSSDNNRGGSGGGNSGGSSGGGGGSSAAPSQPRIAQSSGTGFLVSRKGHVVTNNHVAGGCTEIKVAYSGGIFEKATLLATDQKNDLALLVSDLRPETVPGLKSRVRVGDNVYVYGFPLTNFLSKTGNFTVGYITSAAGLGDDTSQFQISAPVQPGNSGGPLVDKHGNVIGVIVSKLNVLRAARHSGGDIAQNVNFAIKASIAASFLEANGIEVPSNLSDEKLEPADIAARTKKFTVRVKCTKVVR
ncbi:MAG: trypsin-like peptidase domain-containing protein [Hyphomicrobiaceae bacterium]|nr:trypsin-like peptidase domain-containing protein [Hyphomicrobiaceae bacterium]